MATSINTSAQWVHEERQTNKITFLNKWLNYADTQAKNQTLWFLLSLVLQGILFLPVPAVLIYYYQAPVLVLGVTLLLFFANVIAGMGGSGIRVTLTFFAISVVVNLIMAAIFML